MLRITADQIQNLECSAYHALAISIKRRLDKPGNEVDFSLIKQHIEQARSYRVSGRDNITSFVQSMMLLSGSDIDFQRLQIFMQRSDLSNDHKLIALSYAARAISASSNG